MRAEIYSDGSCDENGNGGHGVYIKIIDNMQVVEEIELVDGMGNTTSTQMELKAAIAAIEYIKKYFPTSLEKVDLYSDYYPINDNMGKSKDIKDEKFSLSSDRNLWKKLHFLTLNDDNIFFHWVKGHNGDPDNIKADKLARAGRMKFLFSQKSKVFVYYHNSNKLNKKQNMFNLMIKSEDNSDPDVFVKKMNLFDKDVVKFKDFIDLHTFKETLQYTIKSTKDVEKRKIIMFCDQPSIIRTIMNIKKEKVKLNELRYKEVWNSIMEILNKYDVNVYKVGQSKLHYFNMSVEQHYENQLLVRNMEAAA